MAVALLPTLAGIALTAAGALIYAFGVLLWVTPVTSCSGDHCMIGIKPPEAVPFMVLGAGYVAAGIVAASRAPGTRGTAG